MELYNCYSDYEKELQQIELWRLNDKELVELARKIKSDSDEDVLGDYMIATHALLHIVEELGGRVELLRA